MKYRSDVDQILIEVTVFLVEVEEDTLCRETFMSQLMVEKPPLWVNKDAKD